MVQPTASPPASVSSAAGGSSSAAAATAGASPAFTSSIHAYLDSQSQLTLTRLYSTPAGCLSIFRLLTPLARQIVLGMLWLESAMRKEDLLVWLSTPEGKAQQAQTLALLEHRHIVKELPSSSSRGNKLSLTATFRTNLRLALTGGGTHFSFGVPSEKDDKHSKTPAELDALAVAKWETILHFMVSKGGQVDVGGVAPKPSVLYLLANSGLMADPAGGKNLVKAADRLQITSRGFQFLLEDVHTQQWDLMLNYLRLAPEREMDPIEALAFLFMLGNLELGRGYSTENLTATQLTMLEDLNETGFIYRRSKSKRFYPTRLAASLSSSAFSQSDATTFPSSSAALVSGASKPYTTSATDASSSSAQPKGFIIVETNFRVYAYTRNLLQIAVLNLFVQFRARFPDMVVGEITRAKMKGALEKGITADQIISYLNVHAHPQMHTKNPLLPVTVQDQLRLYEAELRRMQKHDGVLYSDFTSDRQYSLARDYARQLQVLVHDVGPAKRMFFVSTEGHDVIRSYVGQLQSVPGDE